jgi:lysophospholipase L1-like esterase
MLAAAATLGVAAPALIGELSASSSLDARTMLPSAPSPFPFPSPSPSSLRPWRVVGLGDSVTSGFGCDCQDFVAGYAARAASVTGWPVTSVNLGVPGSTSQDLLHALSTDVRTREQVASADVVLVTTGANDVGDALSAWEDGNCGDLSCFDGALSGLRRRTADLVRVVRSLRAGRPTQIELTDYWNVFRDGRAGAARGDAYVTMARMVTARADADIEAGADDAGVDCLDLRPVFDGPHGDANATPLLQADGDHPNADGHAAMAKALMARTWPALTASASPQSRGTR